MKKLITITNIKIAFEGRKFIMPTSCIDSNYLINYNLNCHLMYAAGYLDDNYLTGDLSVINIDDKNQQVNLIESMQQRLAWDAQTANNLINLEASEDTVTINLISLLAPRSLIVVISEAEYNHICEITNSMQRVVQELLLSYLPVKYEYEIV